MDKQREVDTIFEHLNKLKEDGTLVIVEGKNDRAVLEYFGVTQIIEMEAYHTLIEKVVYLAEGREVVLLVDLDREGRKTYGKLKELFVRYGIKVDDSFRNFLFRTKLRQVEGLRSYIRTVNEFF